jgi:hypothetical protein
MAYPLGLRRGLADAPAKQSKLLVQRKRWEDGIRECGISAPRDRSWMKHLPFGIILIPQLLDSDRLLRLRLAFRFRSLLDIPFTRSGIGHLRDRRRGFRNETRHELSEIDRQTKQRWNQE